MSNVLHSPVQFGDYLLLALVGEGATARVYRAIPIASEGEVAVKALHPDVFSVVAEQALEREAQLAQALRKHPNLLLPLAHKRVGAQMALILPYIDGWTLKALLRWITEWKTHNVLMPPSAVVDLLVQISRGLQAVHDLKIDGVHQGLVHRDLKPGNIIIGREHGFVKILDFGLAKFRDRVGTQTQVGAVLGTPLYLSPEQARGEAVDYRSDLFSFGTILYEIMAGRFAFDVEAPTSMTRVKRLLAIRQNVLTVDPEGRDVGKVAEVEAVLAGAGSLLAHCWASNSDDRISSAVELELRLEGLKPEGPTLAEWIAKYVTMLPESVAYGDFGASGPPPEILPDEELGKTSVFLPAIQAPPVMTLTGVHIVALDQGGDEAPANAPFTGIPFGRYELLCLLGAGGQGKVYLARTSSGTLVVLKVLLPDLTDEVEARDALKNEARLGALLKGDPSPYVVQIFPIEQIGGHLCLPMRYVRGWTLEDVLTATKGKRGLPVKIVIDLAIQLFSGVGHLHQLSLGGQSARVVHRDLKPGNVMVTEEGEVKILDFGVAKMEASLRAGAPTQAGTTRGSPGYMSPEQVGGKALDGRSDLFALGTLLYELLIGVPAFFAESIQDVMLSILRVNPAQSRAKVAPISPEMAHFIEVCHARDPEDRFQRAGEAVGQLKEIARVLGGVEGATARFIQEHLARLPSQVPYGYWGADGPPTPVESMDRKSRIFKRINPQDLPSIGMSVLQPIEEMLPGASPPDEDEEDRRPTELVRPLPGSGRVVVQPLGPPTVIQAGYHPEPLALLPSEEIESLPEATSRVPRFVAVAGILLFLLGLGAFFLGRTCEPAPVLEYVSEPTPTFESFEPTPASELPSIAMEPFEVPTPVREVASIKQVKRSVEASTLALESTPHPTLAPEPGLLSVNANLPSTVFLNGERLGVTPLSSREVSVGVHTLRVACAPCSPEQSRELTITVESGKRISRIVTFSE